MRRYVIFTDRRFDTYFPPRGKAQFPTTGYPQYSLKLNSQDTTNQAFQIFIDNDEDEKALLNLLKWIPKEQGKTIRRLSKEEQDYLRSLPSNAKYYK